MRPVVASFTGNEHGPPPASGPGGLDAAVWDDPEAIAGGRIVDRVVIRETWTAGDRELDLIAAAFS